MDRHWILEPKTSKEFKKGARVFLDANKTLDQMMKGLSDDGVDEEQFKSLVKFCLTDEAKEAIKVDLKAHGSTQSDRDKMNWKEDMYLKHKEPEKKGCVRCMGQILKSHEAESSKLQKDDPRDQEIKQLLDIIFCLADVVKDFMFQIGENATYHNLKSDWVTRTKTVQKFI